MDAVPETGGGWRNPAAALHRDAWVRRLAVVLCAIAVSFGGGLAHADGRWTLREAVQKAENAEFEVALEGFGQAERSRDLRREDLVRLYGYRAVVRFALGDRDGMEADLARLLAVDPHARLPRSAPPPVLDAYRRLARLGVSPPRIVVERTERPAGVRFEARVEGGPPGLIHHVRIFARPGEGVGWTRGDGRLSVLAPPGVVVEWYVQGIGPGGAVVTTVGTVSAPLRLRMS